MNSQENIRKIFYPQSIAVIGASTKEKSIGYEILNSIKQYGFKGKIFPVNPRASEILGYTCYTDISFLPDKIDLAIIVVPKIFVEDSITKLLNKNIKSFILITAGFKETGKEGAEAENKILELIKSQNANMIGPNCMGVINTLENIRLNATFVAEKPLTGKTGFLSQSGALGAAVLNSLRETDIKFSHFISVGNKADLNENDITLFWNKDDNIQILTYYLESFEDGLKFIKPFLTNEVTKPAIVLKAGRSESGMAAASSHTGAVSAPDFIVDSLLKQAGIIRAKNLNDLFNISKGFEYFPLPKSNRIAVVTNAGGPAILCVDALAKNNLKLAKLNRDSINKLKNIVNPNGSINNPIDLLPGATKEVYSEVIKILIEDTNVDGIISIFVEPVMVEPFGVVESINSIKSDKPVLQVVMPLPDFWEKYRRNSLLKLPLFRNPEDPAVILSAMLSFRNRRKVIAKNADEYRKLFLKFNNGAYPVKRYDLNLTETSKLLKKFNIPLVREKMLLPQQLNSENFDFPIVLKGINKIISHKTEYSSVELNIKNKEELSAAASRIQKSLTEKGLRVEEFLVQPYIKAKYELLIGGVRDNSFGPVITFGTGGKFVEAYRDVGVISAFATIEDIRDLISSTTIGKILKGYRNETPVDIEHLTSIIKNVALLLIETPQVIELDLNPLIIDESNNFYVVDSRISIGEN